MQSDIRDVEVLHVLLKGLASLADGFDETVQEIRSCLFSVDHWIRIEMPAYWKQQLQRAERDLNSALDDLQQKQSSTRPGDKPAATEAKKHVAKAKQRVNVCHEKIHACRRHRLRLEQLIEAMAGPLMEISEYAASDLPRAMANLKGLIEILEAYSRPTPESPS